MKLTDRQVNFFKTFGYLHFPGLLGPDEAAWIIEEFEATIQDVGGGKNHDGTKRTMFGGPIEHRPRLSGLLDDPRILDVLGGVLGEDFNYCSGDGNYYTGDTGWHPDGNWGQLFAAKLAFYLDPLTASTGALRVIPGSHRPDHWVRKEGIDPNKSLDLYGVHPKDFPSAAVLETQPGDVVIFNHDTYHAAFGGSARRRMFTMNCTRHCTDPEDMATLRKYLSIHSPGGYKVRTGGGMFFPGILDTAGPSRMEHLRQPVDIHNELFPEFARR
ncbi:MAG: phytanoyl-CoA dioxygenase family protein [candidate division Zixibacteria bacterium]|nr:phytanoyl-CoA dioxygenase family protein [candidate division Zixibacteria bacterium]